MILVTAGSQSFDKLIEKVDSFELEDVVFQIGKGVYEPKTGKWFRFSSDFRQYVESADLVVTHTGVGTLIECTNLGKKVISVINKNVVDNHDVARMFEKEKKITLLSGVDKLSSTML